MAIMEKGALNPKMIQNSLGTNIFPSIVVINESNEMEIGVQAKDI
jgi:molecular chaperone DnaK (HSP70)